MNENDLQRLIFMPPDALANEQPECDLLIIDEAAAIPLKLLTFVYKALFSNCFCNNTVWL